MKLTEEEIDAILERHQHWLNADCCGWVSMKADLRGADLCRADLRETDLRGVDLREADLRGANLQLADLWKANLRGACISEESKLFAPQACPDVGSFIGWKKAGGKIIKLAIPADAKRLSATGRKCRCDKAKVLAIQNIDGTDSGLEDIQSNYDKKFVYKLGKTAKVKNFCENRWHECSDGIHFFITREEAVRYE